MEITKGSVIAIVVVLFVSCMSLQGNAYYYKQCSSQGSRCYGQYIRCPAECPSSESTDPKAKVCQIDCDKPTCRGVCRIVVFYFHGKSNEHFTLVSDSTLQINARFIGHRPAGRARDYTWIQALGILFNSKTFSLEAPKTSQWNENVDHLKFTYNGNHLALPEGPLSTWRSPENDVKVERVAARNSIIVTLEDVAEIMVNVVPVTKEDDAIHNYQVPEDDCFAHLEVQFRFFGLSSKVDGVLGRTYREDFENPAKVGVAMPVVGGEDKYRTSSLLSPNCASCVFSKPSHHKEGNELSAELMGTLDCSKFSYGLGIVCKK
ncbi:unnamed protein product [Sphenostylis stenocarpa]|uniref:Uncharacterized protein n=1 Tax=Sphenostylis stenocarpa TaxID=92480 RepID=A0AA86W4P3_9FABA|nr:unnamed protein product [Sphenostylis stenocarpa]